MGKGVRSLLARRRRTEIATLVTVLALVAGGALSERDRDALFVTAGLLALYDVVWFHLLPETTFGRWHFTTGVVVTQTIGFVMLVLTGGAGSYAFPLYVLGVLASGLRPRPLTSALLGAYAVLAYLSLVVVDLVGGSSAPVDLLVSRTIGLGMTAAFVAMIARALERRNAEIALGKQLLEDVIDTVHTAVVSMDQSGRITRWNPEAERTFGWKRSEVLGRTVADTLIPQQYRAAHWKGLRTFVLTGDGPVIGRRIELEALHADGSELPVEVTIAAVPSAGGWSFTAFLTDISARRRRLRELEEQATQDALTGLANRRHLYARLEQVVDLAKREGSAFCVLLMDLDRFKQVNDALGHEVGDELLRAFGRCVASQARESDTVARLGGDEFACVLPGTDAGSAEVVARKVLAACEGPFEVQGHALRARPSVGIATYPVDGTEAPALLHAADVTMYAAKRAGGGIASYPGSGADLSPLRRAPSPSR